MSKLRPRPVFVVGCPRSGTTLVRYILDGHSRIAIAQELNFVVGLAPRRLPWLRSPPATVEEVISHPCFGRLELAPDAVRASVEAARPDKYGDLIDTVMSAYAASRGKERWGDKTPGYLRYLPMLAHHFPTAQFVHVVRDGRDVAASLPEFRFGPPTAISGAFWWRRAVSLGRRRGHRLLPDRYHEVCLEDLVADPVNVVKTVCAYLGEDYEPAMLDYPERPLPRGHAHRHLAKPPTADLRDWQAGLSRRNRRAVEAVCRPVLATLGYAEVPRSTTASMYAWAVVTRDLARQGPAALRTRLRPRERNY